MYLIILARLYPSLLKFNKNKKKFIELITLNLKLLLTIFFNVLRQICLKD